MGEIVAQLAARDVATGVLTICDEAGQSVGQLREVLRAILADDAPRGAVDACLARAIALDAELVTAFPGKAPELLHYALGAAVLEGGDEDFAEFAGELGLKPHDVRQTLLGLHRLSDSERNAIAELSVDETQQASANAGPDLGRPELGEELQKLVATTSWLVRGWEHDPDAAVDLLETMLAHLIAERVGAYARLGRESGVAWSPLVDFLEALSALTDAERGKMAKACAYIRQQSMLITGMEELYAVQP